MKYTFMSLGVVVTSTRSEGRGAMAALDFSKIFPPSYFGHKFK